MTTRSIIDQVAADGVNLTLSATGTLKATGYEVAINRWLPTIREHKAEIIAFLTPGADQMPGEPFDREAFEERAAICEFDSGLSREEAEAIAWHEDDRRRCVQCLNLRPGGICKVAEPGGLVSAVKGYRPNKAVLQRCAGFVERKGRA